MQEESEEVGHEPMTTQAIHVQAVLELVHSLFALAALDIVVVDQARHRIAEPVRWRGRRREVGHDEAQVGSLVMAFGFGDDGSGDGP